MSGPAFDVIVCGSLHLDIMVYAPRLPRPDETVAGARWCQRCAAQGPTPEIRSTVMWVMYPGGGLSMGGKRTPGPR